MSDQQITCSDCGGGFAFTAAEQAFYAEKGLASPPKRCKACRAARKTSGGGAPGGRGAPRRFSNDVNEYRSPMTGGFGEGNNFNARPRGNFGGGAPRSGGGAPRGNGTFGGGGARVGGGAPRGNGGFGGGAPRGNFGGGAPQRQGNARPSSSSSSWGGGGGGGGAGGQRGGGSNEYRSPAFPESRGARPARDGQRGEGNRNDRPAERRAPQREAAPRPEKPKFDITCGECGAGAQVPFRPLEGRQVFCQDCYRARRGVAKEDRDAADAAASAATGVTDAADVAAAAASDPTEANDANDTGIVE